VSDTRHLLNATAVMASGTMVSRVLGYVRTAMMGAALGASSQRVEVFSYSQSVPNALFTLLAAGTLNSVLVPQIVRAIANDEDGGKAYVDRIITGFILILGAVTVILTVAAPWVTGIYTSGDWRTPAMAVQWQSLVLMAYITMPQIFFYGMFLLVGQVLNARERFGPMMWAPIANNVISIAMFAIYLGMVGTNVSKTTAFTTPQVWLLGGCSTLAVVLQMAVLLPFMRRAGFRYHPRFDLRGTGLGQTVNVAKWALGMTLLAQVCQIVFSQLASTAAPTADGGMAGGLTAFNDAQLIWILPHSVLTISLATAMLPAASRYAKDGDMDGLADETTRSMRLVATFIVPAAVAFLVLADPIVRLLIAYGNAAADYHVVTWALAAMAIGLVPYSMQYLLLRPFYALSNTKTLFFLQIVITVANVGLSILFVLAWAQPSTVASWLAGGYAGGYVVGVFVTFRALRRRLPALDGRALMGHMGRLVVAAVPAVAVAWVIVWAGSRWRGLGALVVSVLVAAVAALVVYFLVAKRLGIAEVDELGTMVRRFTGAVTGLGRRLTGRAAKAPAGSQPDDDAAEATVKLPRVTAPPPVATPGIPGPYMDFDAPTTVFARSVDMPTAELVNLDPDGRGVFIPIAAPSQPGAPISSAMPLTGAPPEPAQLGDMLGDRFQLEQLLAQRRHTYTWRALDHVLRRPVLIHLLTPDNPNAETITALARRSAAATDGRVLRVLDVVDADALSGQGAYLVYEYVAGQTLASIVEGGPLTGAESAWVVREVADVVAGLHADGLCHGHLSPATVLISTTGNIKITGLLVDAAFDSGDVADDPQRDVVALGALLYACLVARWPGGDAYGLPAAPVRAGVLAPPSAVRRTVDPALESVVDRILSPVPQGHASRLTTAAEVTTALSLVLGPASAAGDLRVRMAMPPQFEPQSHVAPPVPAMPDVAFRFAAGAGETAALDVMDDGEDFQAESVFMPVPPPPKSASGAKRGGSAGSGAGEKREGRRWRPLVLIGVTVLVGAVVAVAATGSLLIPLPALSPTTATTPSATPTPTPTPTVLAIHSAVSFDPTKDGGAGSENAAQAKLAIDGDPSTAWYTARYHNRPNLGGLKPGTGLLLDLGHPSSVTSVALQLVGTGTSVELRVPKTNADQAPTATVNDWTVVASATKAGTTVTLTPKTPVISRYLLVYLTLLPPDGTSGGYYKGGIAEITVNG